MKKEKAMTRVKRIVTTTCAASFLLGWTGMSNLQLLIPFRSAGASVLLAQQSNSKASYNQGYQLGRKDAKHGQNSDNRRQRNESSQWNSEFRRGYEDGYAGRSRNDGTYDLSRNDGIYDRSRNEDLYGRSGNDQSYRGAGTMTWRGRVDDYVELNIQGNRVRSREREGSQTLNEQVSFSNPLPRADVTVSVRKRNGRGQVSVVQQPNQSNNYTAIIKIDDNQGGADDYEIEMQWNGTYDSRNYGVYDRSRNDGIYGRSGNEQSYSGPGTMTWRGRVDDYVELNIQGNRVRSREREGSQTLNEQVSFSNPLPRANVTVSVRKRNGRGRVSVVQQPNQSNNYTAIVKIDDDKGGADDYEIEMEWR
jgi:flagellar hook assembly protein FlgD